MKSILVFIVTLFCSPILSFAQNQEEIKLGFIGSLSSFASNYGQAALDGAKLAVKELEKEGTKVKLFVEDDQSETKNVVAAYTKLSSIDQVQGIIGGTWFVNAIVKPAEAAKLPIVSCETLYDQGTVLGTNYFLLQGDLHDWVTVYESLVSSRGLTRGATIRFSSGFGATLAEGMESLFSRPGRRYLGAIEYSDIQAHEAGSVALRLKKLAPEVVYIDAQPAGLANILRKLKEQNLNSITIFTNSIAEDLRRSNLIDLSAFPNLYFTSRTTADAHFMQRFKDEYHREPVLNADLGYYSVLLLAKAIQQNNKDPISILKAGITLGEKTFQFSADLNLYRGLSQRISKISGDKVEVLHFD